MLVRLLLVLTAVPLAELMLLVWIAEHTSLGFTVALVLVTGAVGAWLARWQGITALRRIEEDLRKHRMPTDAIIDGVLVLVAGVMLVTPGVMTDSLGLLLLLPPTRRLFKASMRAYLKGRVTVYRRQASDEAPFGEPFDHDQIIEGHILEQPSDDAV